MHTVKEQPRFHRVALWPLPVSLVSLEIMSSSPTLSSIIFHEMNRQADN
jgi:hypothetical protein